MASIEEALARASWVSGEPYAYGPDDAGYYDEHPNHVVGRSFTLDETALADGCTLAIAVLGYARVLINGRALGNVELLGHWTNFTKLVYVDRFEVGALVMPGENRIEIELGNGFYNPAPLTLFGKYNLRERLAEVGTPQVLAAVMAGGTPVVLTDASWEVRPGGLRFNNLYLGEVADLAFDPAQAPWRPVRAWRHDRVLAPAPVPPCRRLGTVEPVSLVEVPDGVLVDFGEMVAGVIDIAFTAAAGARVELTYAEVAERGVPRYDSNVAGLVGMETPRGVCPGGPGAPTPAIQRDVLRCREGLNRYTSTFTYHSFRYVLARGLTAAHIRSITASYIHTDVRQIGMVETDCASFDALMDAAVRTKLNNVHGIFEDCSRERFGYGGDMVSLATSNFMLFDEAGLIDKTLGDFSRDQTERGGLPETAPFMGIGSNGPAYGEGPLLWQLAYPYLAVQADRFFGRRDLIEREWGGLERFGAYVLSFDPAELASHCLGDHGSVLTGGAEGFKSGTPDKEFVGWCAILWCLDALVQAGRRVDKDVARFARAADELRTEIIARFRRVDASFGDGTQTACAFAGMLGLGDPDEQARLLARDMRVRDGVLTTGIFGTMLAFDLLHRTGHDDAVETWLLRRAHPSLLAMLDSGSGALAEQFTEDLSSFNHAMFSSYAQWLFEALGGIRVADDAVACDAVVIDPYLSPRTDRVACSYATPHGVIEVRWERGLGGTTEVAVTLPAGVVADTARLDARNDVALTLTVR